MADTEAPLVLETPGGLSVSYKGRLLYSGREPAKIPRQVAAACDRGPARLLLVPSPLLWYGLSELLAAMGEGSAVLCVEADRSLAKLARERMPEEIAVDSRVAFIDGASFEEAAEAADRLGSFRTCALVRLSGGESLNADLYRGLSAALVSRFESDWRNRAALMALGGRWARNIFDNLAGLEAIAPAELPSFPGAVVVCGAGPSLEGALPFIARQASCGTLRVIACDTALGSLLASGIKPDLVVCLEAQAYNLGDFTCLGNREIRLAADLSSHPAGFRAVRGPKHVSFVRITASSFLDRVEDALRASGAPFLEMPPLGSVGVHAVRLASETSVGPIFATGLDFCFEPGKTHARGCPSLLAAERDLGRLRRWPSQFAVSFRDRNIDMAASAEPDSHARLLSDPVLLSYAELLAQGSAVGRPDKRGSGSGVELYDIRGRGPAIGMRRITLSEAESLVEGLGSGGPFRANAGEAPYDAGRDQERRCGAAIAAFLDGEAARLSELRSTLRGGIAVSRGELAKLVSEVDYLYWSFPDRPRAGDLSQDFLNRLVPQLEYWSMRIAGLRSAL
jgi:hypothetical protein